ncbi:MAG: hypothetical protein CYPHOPRED_003915 [Cyphobasidiales sp. Tagirdzhanova-0007]|nr:MAG: hypothetical protein CYPHOPRED_003915 [Cyphobasidiales sp. Tagirdzhanova-0007]
MVVGPSQKMDFECELACLVSKDAQDYARLTAQEAEEYIFGLVILNDWSARDLQSWEWVPLGPFTGKNTCTSISPWIVTLDALKPFEELPVADYLSAQHTFNITMTVAIKPAEEPLKDHVVSHGANFRKMYWSFPQMVSHHAISGCNLRNGDLYGSGTISDYPPYTQGCLLEATKNGAELITLGSSPFKRAFLLDGDEVTISAICGDADQEGLVGFEECLNQNHPQKAFTPQTYEDLNVENGFPADLFGAIALQADLLPLHLAEKFVKIPIRAQREGGESKGGKRQELSRLYSAGNADFDPMLIKGSLLGLVSFLLRLDRQYDLLLLLHTLSGQRSFGPSTTSKRFKDLRPGLGITGVYAESVGIALGETSKVGWIPTVGQVLITVAAPPICLAADIHGRKPYMLAVLACGFIGMIVSATAHTMNVAIGGAVIGGMAFCGQPLALAIASEVLPRRYRAYAQAGQNIAVGFSGVIGSLVGGAFISNNTSGAGWRWLFGLPAIIYFLAFVIFAVAYVPATARPNTKGISNHTRLMQIDWFGAALLTFGLVPLLMGLTWLNSPYLVSNPHVFANIAIGSVFFIAFGLYEWKGRTDGLLHHALFQHRAYPIVLGLEFVEGAVFFAFTVWWPQQLTLGFFHNETGVGQRYVAFWVALILFSPAVGQLSKYLKDARILCFVGFLLFAGASIGMLALPTSHTGEIASVAFITLAGAGFAFPFILLLSVAQWSAPGELLGLASANMLASRGVGGAIGSAAYGAIFANRIKTKLPDYVLEAVVPLGFPVANAAALLGVVASGEPAVVRTVPGTTPAIVQAAIAASNKAFNNSFRYLWILELILVFIAVGGCLFIPPVSQWMTYKIDAPADKENAHSDDTVLQAVKA